MKEKFAVAMREDGKFFALDESYGATSPFWVTHPAHAKRIEPFEASSLSAPTYYFESSDRMRAWLSSHRMVWVELETNFTLGSEGPKAPERRVSGGSLHDAMINYIKDNSPFYPLAAKPKTPQDT